MKKSLPLVPPAIAVASIAFLTAAQTAKQGKQLKRHVLNEGVYAEGVCFADVDGDGTEDLVAGPFYYTGPEFKKEVRFRPGEAVSHNGYDHNCFLSWVLDANKDGRMDILQVGHKKGFHLLLYLQPDKPSEDWPKHEVVSVFGNESPELIDMTGDGIPEMVAMEEGKFGFYQINTDDPTKPWPFHAISPKRKPFPYFHGLGIGDINGDGRLDIVEKDGWFEAPKDPLKDEWPYHDYQFSKQGGAQMLIYDIDGDGDNDIVTSLWAHGWGLAWFENVAGTTGITFEKHELMPMDNSPGVNGVKFTQHHALGMGDFNGDGLTDFVTGKRYWAHNGRDPDAKGPVVTYWYELKRTNKGAEFIPHLLHNDTGAGTQLAVSDVNKDGITDIGVGNKKGVFVFVSE